MPLSVDDQNLAYPMAVVGGTRKVRGRENEGGINVRSERKRSRLTLENVGRKKCGNERNEMLSVDERTGRTEGSVCGPRATGLKADDVQHRFVSQTVSWRGS